MSKKDFFSAESLKLESKIIKDLYKATKNISDEGLQNLDQIFLKVLTKHNVDPSVANLSAIGKGRLHPLNNIANAKKNNVMENELENTTVLVMFPKMVKKYHLDNTLPKPITKIRNERITRKVKKKFNDMNWKELRDDLEN